MFVWFKRSKPPQELKRWGPIDRLRTLPDVELDLDRVIEGCCAHYHGISFDGNPWPRNYPAFWEGWRTGWLNAALWREMWELEDNKTWLRETVNN